MSTVTIPFQNTTIRGNELTSVHGKKYYRFLGIPYAKPPIKELRFMPPQPVHHYTEEIDATKFKSPCLQVSFRTETLLGSEDCLYINVYIPELPSKNLKAVIFYIYGGLFQVGSSVNYQPHLLMEYDVIFVTFNYRLNVLGFLNLDLPECPGNAGLKDAVCALKWVKKNVKYFGGDSENITVQGCSSGSSMVHLMTMSPLCKNLIKQVILESGDALAEFNEVHTPTEIAFQLGQILGYQGNDKMELLNIFKHVSAAELLNAGEKLNRRKTKKLFSYYFLPSVEAIIKDSFLPDIPENLYKSADPIPTIALMCECEHLPLILSKKYKELLCPSIHLVRKEIHNYFTIEKEKLVELSDEVIQFYFRENNDVDAIRNFYTDFASRYYYTTFNFMMKNSLPTYFCKFSYVGDCNNVHLTYSKRIPFDAYTEANHGCNVAYNFINTIKFNPSEKDFKVAHQICTFWSNFANNPNCEEFGNLWKPITSENPCYLQMNDELKFIEGYPNHDRVMFWKYLQDKYSLKRRI